MIPANASTNAPHAAHVPDASARPAAGPALVAPRCLSRRPVL